MSISPINVNKSTIAPGSSRVQYVRPQKIESVNNTNTVQKPNTEIKTETECKKIIFPYNK